uniref:LRAT domain-containing protein n=1 Tax=Echinostoma caproni TaxID=27848 RepID=A0A183ASP4_9TREM
LALRPFRSPRPRTFKSAGSVACRSKSAPRSRFPSYVSWFVGKLRRRCRTLSPTTSQPGTVQMTTEASVSAGQSSRDHHLRRGNLSPQSSSRPMGILRKSGTKRGRKSIDKSRKPTFVDGEQIPEDEKSETPVNEDNLGESQHSVRLTDRLSDLSSIQTEMYRFVQEQYVAQQRKIPPSITMRSPRSSTVMEHSPRKQQQDGLVYGGVNGTGACAAITTRLSHYRFLTYDLNQPKEPSTFENGSGDRSECLLRQRHGARPRVGDVLIFLNGHLAYIGSTLSGYPGECLTERDLEKRVLECQYAVFNRGFNLPTDFQFP